VPTEFAESNNHEQHAERQRHQPGRLPPCSGKSGQPDRFLQGVEKPGDDNDADADADDPTEAAVVADCQRRDHRPSHSEQQNGPG